MSTFTDLTEKYSLRADDIEPGTRPGAGTTHPSRDPMKRAEDADDRGQHIPSRLHRLFWDLDPGTIDLAHHRRQIIHRVLAMGDWEAIQWLRREVGDDGLRGWFLETHGRGLDPPRLRFWQLVLELPGDEVDRWIEVMGRDPWHGRGRREVA